MIYSYTECFIIWVPAVQKYAKLIQFTKNAQLAK